MLHMGVLKGSPGKEGAGRGSKRGSKTWPLHPLEVSSAAGSPDWQAAPSHAASQPCQCFPSCLSSPGQTLEFHKENNKRALSKVVCV